MVWRIAAFVLIITSVCCSKQKFQSYSPHESLLSIAAEFELLDSRNPYTDAPAEELTGQNIARATLVRLANYESLHPARFTPEIDFMRARAWERLAEYEAAIRAFRSAAQDDSPLRDEALRRADFLQQLTDALQASAGTTGLEQLLVSLQRQSQALKSLTERFEDPHYAAIARAEAEQSDVRLAEFIALNRMLIANGEDEAIETMRRLVANHTASHRALEHALRLARLYREIAEEEIRLHPPHTAQFDSERALRMIDESLDLYYRVSQADGREERILAARELDATIALRELVLQRMD